MATVIEPRVRYEDDLFAWTQEQAALLRAHAVDGIDWENLAEEIESMGRRDRRELKSRLRVILLHLLKWQAQPSLRGCKLAQDAAYTAARDPGSAGAEPEPAARGAGPDARGLHRRRQGCDRRDRPACRRVSKHVPLCAGRRPRRGPPADDGPLTPDGRGSRSRSPRGHYRDRPHPGAGRAVRHPGPGRPRRRDHQGRAAAGRRGARLGPALRCRPGRFLLHRHQPQQALARPRSRAGPRARACCCACSSTPTS